MAARRSELRRVLEALAVRLACHRATETIRKQTAAMVDLLAKDTHELIVAGAANDYLADALAPLQGLSRRFWFTHVVDHHAEITAGSKLHTEMLGAILRRDVEAAEAASQALNDYLVEFSYAALRTAHDGSAGAASRTPGRM